ncbi:hypothetical protein NDU88_003563 [Pleurodeles waltl]|uniref:Uncharacterized protein n=1 Tax=Pleurodeles waltl TaxID=8319 RepID=A0AAV7M4N1_PLEWA|nr:hypothetical protein NDU88_003563 [Pleurodeles waltl]
MVGSMQSLSASAEEHSERVVWEQEWLVGFNDFDSSAAHVLQCPISTCEGKEEDVTKSLWVMVSNQPLNQCIWVFGSRFQPGMYTHSAAVHRAGEARGKVSKGTQDELSSTSNMPITGLRKGVDEDKKEAKTNSYA